MRHPKKPRRQFTNPLQKALHSFLDEYISKLDDAQKSSIDLNSLTTSIPKRYTFYPQLLLLPSNAFSTTPAWTLFISQLGTQDQQTLYQSIIEAFSPQAITHIAINSPISPTSCNGTPNMTRSPTGLLPLHGDFGPRALWSADDNDAPAQPSEPDFATALWVHTTQNGGIFQTWAPLWTMFSRGNVGEKARILGGGEGTFEGLDGAEGLLGQELTKVAVVDMYVGIGYFAFSYLKRGLGRVFGWEVNGWSVEGLRRGCVVNGWGVRVLRVDEEGMVEDEAGSRGDEALERLVEELGRDGGVRMVVFRGDNRWGRRIIESMKVMSEKAVDLGGDSSWLDIRHISLGLLPSSRLSWEDAIDMLDRRRGGWVHVHENVDVREMEQEKDSIVQCFQEHLRDSGSATCSHIEQVKTYAPGVMHCVFDMHIDPTPISEAAIENE